MLRRVLSAAFRYSWRVVKLGLLDVNLFIRRTSQLVQEASLQLHPSFLGDTECCVARPRVPRGPRARPRPLRLVDARIADLIDHSLAVESCLKPTPRSRVPGEQWNQPWKRAWLRAPSFGNRTNPRRSAKLVLRISFISRKQADFFFLESRARISARQSVGRQNNNTGRRPGSPRRGRWKIRQGMIDIMIISI